MTDSKFVGKVPSWIDPETTGVPFEYAPGHYGTQPLLEFVSAHFPNQIHEIGNISFNDVLTRKPRDVQSKWWTWRDVEMPFLLRSLISGKIRAFGATDRADASPVWIPPRLWKDLQPDLNNQRCFSGAGAVYWNVRVVSLSEIKRKCSVVGVMAPSFAAHYDDTQQLPINSKRGPKTESLNMTSTLEKLYRDGHKFTSKMQAYSAVLKQLNIKDVPRGCSYDSFCRHCVALLNRDAS